MNEFESYPEMPVDFSTFISNKAALQKTVSSNGFDPHQVMVNKKKLENGETVELPPEVKWPEKDVKALEDFCNKHGILGFNSGRMSPIAALAFLKSRMGIMDAPLEERVPYGYTKIGQSNNKPSILHG